VRIIARSTLKRFIEAQAAYRGHGALKSALDSWFEEVRKASWKSTADVKRLYRTASIVSADRVVFNIKGNDYRLVVAVDFEKSYRMDQWIGTHAEYDNIDVKTVSYEKPKTPAK